MAEPSEQILFADLISIARINLGDKVRVTTRNYLACISLCTFNIYTHMHLDIRPTFAPTTTKPSRKSEIITVSFIFIELKHLGNTDAVLQQHKMRYRYKSLVRCVQPCQLKRSEIIEATLSDVFGQYLPVWSLWCDIIVSRRPENTRR